MSFFTGNNYCNKCGKPLGIFEQGLCVECEKAEKAEQDKCKHNCEECEHNDGECCRILFERAIDDIREETYKRAVLNCMGTIDAIRAEILHWEKDSNEDDLYQLGAMDMQSYVLRVIDKYTKGGE